MTSRRPGPLLCTLASALLLGGCTHAGAAGTASGSGTGASAPGSGTQTATAGTGDGASASIGAGDAAGATTSGGPAHRPSKVMLIVEENTDSGDALGSSTPYLDSVVKDAARVQKMEAGYPTPCPSLPAYLILTSGSRHGICDDKDPAQHPVAGANLFSEVAASGQEWRVFAESMGSPCQRSNSVDDHYLVRHTAAPYYTSETQRCERWQVPLGTPEKGALHDALGAGLPAFSLVVPDRCDDMHGGSVCTGDRRATGDAWLKRWLPQVLTSQDYRAGELAVVLTWDEGSLTSNDIATLVFHPSVAGTTVTGARTHCSTLRTISDLLGVDPLGCSAQAQPLVPALEG